jgi:hypothetical protein
LGYEVLDRGSVNLSVSRDIDAFQVQECCDLGRGVLSKSNLLAALAVIDIFVALLYPGFARDLRFLCSAVLV